MNGDQHPDQLVNQGLQAHLAGDRGSAEGYYRQALEADADNAEALHLLGVLAMDAGRLEEARELVTQSLEAREAYPEAQNTLGSILKEIGDAEGALAAYERAVELVPQFAAAWINLGDLQRRAGDLNAAADALERASASAPGLPAALAVAGAIRLDQANVEEAVSLLRQAVTADGHLLEARVNLCEALRQADALNDALTLAGETASLFPHAAPAWNALGTVRYDRRDYIGALEAYDKALSLDPENIDAGVNRGNALARLHRLNEAADALEKALAQQPGHPTALVNLGGVRQALGDVAGALKLFDQALAIELDHADGIWNRGLARLLTGDLAGGFADYDVRWRLPEFTQRHADIPLWDGGALDGKTILVHSEQGYGDTLQFIRYAPLLAEKGATVIVETHGPLVRLLSLVEGVTLVIARGEEVPTVDLQAPVMSLPHLFETDANSIPAATPYLKLAPDGEIDLGDIGDDKPVIGFAWAGRPTHKNDLNRSIPLEDFQELVSGSDAQWVSLQIDDRGDQLSDVDWGADVLDLRPQIHDFAESATAIAALDLVITVDTAVAHLAGALGKPVWVLLPFAPDWRWQLERNDSPWYPSARLFSQPKIGDWDSVMKEVAAALAEFEEADG
jgi:tetratricopeptide (TPR) repeat protein